MLHSRPIGAACEKGGQPPPLEAPRARAPGERTSLAPDAQNKQLTAAALSLLLPPAAGFITVKDGNFVDGDCREFYVNG